MIYTVECSFADPASETGWNHFYSHEKLPALISVTGFHTSQRFRSIRDNCPAYLAIHTVDSLDVLSGEEYRRKGGGNFGRWQQHITDWHRNLYSDIGLAPAVNADELLVLCESGLESLIAMGLEPLAMHAVAQGKRAARRWLAVLSRQNAPTVENIPQNVYPYAPITAQLTRSDAVGTAR
jgi:hypothetical protein